MHAKVSLSPLCHNWQKRDFLLSKLFDKKTQVVDISFTIENPYYTQIRIVSNDSAVFWFHLPVFFFTMQLYIIYSRKLEASCNISRLIINESRFSLLTYLSLIHLGFSSEKGMRLVNAREARYGSFTPKIICSRQSDWTSEIECGDHCFQQS